MPIQQLLISSERFPPKGEERDSKVNSNDWEKKSLRKQSSEVSRGFFLTAEDYLKGPVPLFQHTTYFPRHSQTYIISAGPPSPSQLSQVLSFPRQGMNF